MGFNVADLSGTLGLDHSEFTEGVSSAVEKLTEGVSSMLESLGDLEGGAGEIFAGVGKAGVAMGLAVIGAAAGVTAAVIELGRRGSEVNDVSDAFDRLTASAGGQEKALHALQTGSQGLISNFDLMQAANKSLSAGWKASADDLQLVSSAAVVLGHSMGVDAKTAYDELMDSMASGRARQLVNLGLLVDQKEANHDLAAAMKAEGEAVTTAATAEEMRSQILEKLAEKVAQLGPAELTFADKLTSVRVGIANFVDALSSAVASSPAVNAALSQIASGLISTFGADQQHAVVTIAGYIDVFMTGLVRGAAMVLTAVADIVSYFGIWATTTGVVGRLTEELTQTLGKYGVAAAAVGVAMGVLPKTALDLSIDIMKASNVTDGFFKKLGDVGVGAIKTAGAMQTGAEWLSRLADGMDHASAEGVKHIQTMGAVAETIVQATAKTAEFQKKQTEVAQSIDDLDERIANLQKAGYSWDQIIGLLGKDSDDTIAKAAQYGVALLALDRNLVQLALDFRLAQFDQLAEKAFGKLPATLETALHSGAQQFQTWVTGVGNGFGLLQKVSSQWSAQFGHDREMDYANALIWSTGLQKELFAAYQAGTITYDELSKALGQINNLFGGMAGNAGAVFKHVLSTSLGNIGDVIIGAIQNGGGGNRIGSSIGGSLGNSLGKAGSAAIGDALGTGVGAALGSFLPGIGTLLGGMLGGVVGDLFKGSSGRDAVTQFAATFGGFDHLHTQLQALGADGEKMWQQLSGVGQDDAKGASQIIDQITTSLHQHQDAIQANASATDDFINSQGGPRHLASELHLAGQAGDDLWTALVSGRGSATPGAAQTAIDNVTASLKKQQDAAEGIIPHFTDLMGVAGKYGLTLDQLGKKFQQSDVATTADSLMADFNELIGAGADFNGVLDGMGPKFQGVVTEALKYGVQIPDSMKPVLQAMIDQGKLVDENGDKLTDLTHINFSESLADSVKDLSDTVSHAIDRLVDALSGNGPGSLVNAAGVAVDKINEKLSGIHAPTFTTPGVGFPNGGPDTGDVVVGDAPLQTVSEPGMFYLRQGDLFGMPHMGLSAGAASALSATPGGFSGGGTTVQVIVQTPDSGGMRRLMRSPDFKRELVDLLNDDGETRGKVTRVLGQ